MNILDDVQVGHPVEYSSPVHMLTAKISVS